MGGGGFGHRYSSSGESSKNTVLTESKETFANENYGQQVNTLLAEQLSEFNNRNTEKIRFYLQTIKDAINEKIDGTVDTRFGGSVSKNTYVEGLSDIDTLVFLNGSGLDRLSPRDVKNYFTKLLKEKFPKAEVKKGNLCVTVKFKDYEIQLLPAVKNNNGIKIPDGNTQNWSKAINPSAFARQLTITNAQNGNKVIPTIKIVKGMNSQLNRSQQLNGYHIEALAVEIFKNYSGRRTYKDMVSHFFNQAQKHILNPIREKTGQSKFVDNYLGDKGSSMRERIAVSLKRICNKISSADKNGNIDTWGEFLNI